MFLEDLPIMAASFINKGAQVLLSGNRKHYYLYDLNAQKLQKLSGIMGHDSEKSLSNLTCGESKYYCFTNKEG